MTQVLRPNVLPSRSCRRSASLQRSDPPRSQPRISSAPRCCPSRTDPALRRKACQSPCRMRLVRIPANRPLNSLWTTDIQGPALAIIRSPQHLDRAQDSIHRNPGQGLQIPLNRSSSSQTAALSQLRIHLSGKHMPPADMSEQLVHIPSRSSHPHQFHRPYLIMRPASKIPLSSNRD